MGFAEVEQWWEAWQLCLLVLGSLLLQLFHMVAVAMRRRRIPPWFRFLTWAAYQGSDALAIYALATLFNRRDKQQLSLEALWAPILLHACASAGRTGQEAFVVSDCSCHLRLLQIMAKRGQEFAAGSNLALHPGLPGTLKCLEKPFALWRASISTIAATVGSRACKVDDDDDLTTKLEKDISLEEFVKQAAWAYENNGDPANKERRVPAGDHRVKDNPYRLFIDIPYPLRIRLANLRYMSKKRNEAHRRVQSSLSKAFNRLYTNYKGYPGAVLRAVLVLLTIVAIRLFIMRRSGGGAYGAADLKVTYVLLSCTVALECISAITMARCRMMSEPPWPDQVAQCNLLMYMASGRRHRRLRMLASWLRWDRLWYYMGVPPRNSRSLTPPSPAGITEMVHDHISTQWRQHIGTDKLGYCGEASKNPRLASSVPRPFDESVILWHLATEFCFFSHVDEGSKENRRCLEISNYMVYLLLAHPEMLMPGARYSSILWVAYNQVKEMLGEQDDAQDMAWKIILRMKAGPAAGSGLIHEAWELAGELMESIGDKSDGDRVVNMWKVIRGVWVEMLCFSSLPVGAAATCTPRAWWGFSFLRLDAPAGSTWGCRIRRTGCRRHHMQLLWPKPQS